MQVSYPTGQTVLSADFVVSTVCGTLTKTDPNPLTFSYIVNTGAAVTVASAATYFTNPSLASTCPVTYSLVTTGSTAYTGTFLDFISNPTLEVDTTNKVTETV